MKPKISVIIVAYNNFETTTGRCLKSLLDSQQDEPLELVVIDNASQDSSPKELKKLASIHPSITLSCNESNRGFAGGNNDGVALATGETIILLNSDTIVPPGSITKLARILNNNPDCSLLSPVTNQAGNEQKIFTSGSSSTEILQEGAEWCSHSLSYCFLSERLDFFCVAMAKKTYVELGGLDEEYGLGYFEDTDFSIKAMQRGYQQMITEDVFIYHQAGQSFSKFKRNYVKRLMRQNRAKLESKYPGRVTLYHLRDNNIKIMEQYVCLKQTAPKSDQENIDFKFANRLQLAKSLMPSGLLKRFIYWRKLNALCKKIQVR